MQQCGEPKKEAQQRIDVPEASEGHPGDKEFNEEHNYGGGWPGASVGTAGSVVIDHDAFGDSDMISDDEEAHEARDYDEISWGEVFESCEQPMDSSPEDSEHEALKEHSEDDESTEDHNEFHTEPVVPSSSSSDDMVGREVHNITTEEQQRRQERVSRLCGPHSDVGAPGHFRGTTEVGDQGPGTARRPTTRSQAEGDPSTSKEAALRAARTERFRLHRTAAATAAAPQAVLHFASLEFRRGDDITIYSITLKFPGCILY